MVKFQESGHRYESVIPDGKRWVSITGLTGSYKKPFDDVYRAESCSVKEGSPWRGIHPDEIRRVWKEEGERSIKLGHWYHARREEELISRGGCYVSPVVGGWKQALPQKLQQGIYPEMLIYHPTLTVCGQSDYVERQGNSLIVRDFKTSKKIDRQGYMGKRMLAPLNHLEQCEFNVYALQLSLYAHMLLRHNPDMHIQELTIEHVKFSKCYETAHGYPVYGQDGKSGWVVRDVEKIPVPFLQKEVELVLENLSEKKTVTR